MRDEDAGAPSIAILPWVDLDEPLMFRGVEFLPGPEAVARGTSVGGHDLSAHITSAISYFCSGSRMFRLDTPQMSEVEPHFIQPTVVFLNETVTPRKLDEVLALLNFACMAANSPGGRYTNSQVFDRYLQALGGDPGRILIPMARRQFGAKLLATEARFLIESRRHWVGVYQRPEKHHFEAMQSLPEGDERADRIVATLAMLMGATQEAETTTEDVERSLFAVALERLLEPTNLERNEIVAEINAERATHGHAEMAAKNVSGFDYNLRLAKKALAPLLGHEVTDDRYGHHILRAWYAIRQNRNASFHPAARGSARFPFERQDKVRENLISFRVVQALVVALMIDASFVPADSVLALVVPAIESWLSSIEENDPRDAEAAMSTYDWWSHLMFTSTFAERRSGADDWRPWLSQSVAKVRVPRPSPVPTVEVSTI